MSNLLQEQYQHIWIGKIRRQAYFTDIVKRLAEGKSVSSVARWLVTIQPTGELAHLSYATWKKYLNALAPYVKNYVLESKKRKYSPSLTREVAQKVRKVSEELANIPNPENSQDNDPLWKATKEALREIDAETTLKCAAIVQLNRVNSLVEKSSLRVGPIRTKFGVSPRLLSSSVYLYVSLVHEE